MLRTAWTDAWEAPESPGTLPMPLQFIAQLVRQRRRWARNPPPRAGGHARRPDREPHEPVRTSKQVVFEMIEEYVDVTQKLAADLED